MSINPLKILPMIKSWLIAAGLLIAGLFAAIFIGRRKQYDKDNKIAANAVKENLDKISAVAKKVQDETKKNPDTGPDSSANRLRRDWSED